VSICFCLRKKDSIDMVIMVVLEPRCARGAPTEGVEGSGVHGLLLYHHHSLSQADQGETRLLLSCTPIHEQSKHPQK
jgi:hypothetical protein